MSISSSWDLIVDAVFTDDYSTFKRVYETPILKSRAPGCSAKEAELGEARSAQVGIPYGWRWLRRRLTDSLSSLLCTPVDGPSKTTSLP